MSSNWFFSHELYNSFFFLPCKFGGMQRWWHGTLPARSDSLLTALYPVPVFCLVHQCNQGSIEHKLLQLNYNCLYILVILPSNFPLLNICLHHSRHNRESQQSLVISPKLLYSQEMTLILVKGFRRRKPLSRPLSF